MVRNMLQKFIIVLISVGVLVSCNNLSDITENVANNIPNSESAGEGNTNIPSTNLEDDHVLKNKARLIVKGDYGLGRTAFPDYDLNETDLSLTLTAESPNGGNVITIGSWKTKTEMQADSQILIDAGEWIFVLSVHKDGKQILTGTCTQTVNVGDNELSFNLKAPATGNGNLSFTLNFPSSGVTTVDASLLKLDNTLQVGPKEIILDSSTSDTSKVTYTLDNVPANLYIAKIELKSTDGSVLGVWTEVVQIAPGMTTTAEQNMKYLTYTVKLYNPDGTSSLPDQKFIHGVNKSIPYTEPIDQGYIFVGWSETQGSDSVTYTADEAFNPGESTSLHAVFHVSHELYVVANTGNDSNNGSNANEPLATIQKAVDIANKTNDEQPYTIYVNGEITDSDVDRSNTNSAFVNISSTKTMNLTIAGDTGGATINANRTDSSQHTARVMYIGANANVTLQNIELIGGKVADYGGGVYIASDGALTLGDGAIIGGNTAITSGGGAYIASGGILTINGGTIGGDGTPNTSNSYGGGVWNEGEFILSTGFISYNTSSSNGGGVYNDGTFRMDGGTLTDNEITGTGNGGGVYNASNTAQFIMTDGAISKNQAPSNGGGVCVYDGTFTMNGGNINSGNGARNGGGVYVDSNGEFTMGTGATISGNTATSGGGGVFVKKTFEMTDGVISNNSSPDGGGVYVDRNGELTLKTGAVVSGNKATGTGTGYGGGGVYIAGSGTFNMEGGTIGDATNPNTAANGGGVFASATAIFTMSGGSISGNTATDDGGGVYSDGTFNMSGSAIVNTNNDVYLPSGKKITVDGVLTGTAPVATITPESYSIGTQVLDGSQVDEVVDRFWLTPKTGEEWKIGYNGNLFKYDRSYQTGTLTSAVSATDVLQNLVDSKSVSFDMTSETPFTPLNSYENGGNFTGGGKDYAIHVPANTTLVINGNNNFLKEAVRCGNLLNVEGTLVLNDVRIAGTNLHWSVIDVLDGAMVILNNCIIENNRGGHGTNEAGGVICIAKDGTVIMNGGKIEGNHLAGANIYDGGSFTINGGVIQNNQLGGVRKEANATYVNEGGTVDEVEDY